MNIKNNIKKLITISKIEHDLITVYENILSTNLSNQSINSKIDYLVERLFNNKQSMFTSYTNDYSGLDIDTHNGRDMENICCILNDKYPELSHQQLCTISYLLVEIILNRPLSLDERSITSNAIIINDLFEEELSYFKKYAWSHFNQMQNIYCSDCSWKSNSTLKLVMLSLYLIQGNVYELYYEYETLIESVSARIDFEPHLREKINNVRKILRTYL